MHKWPKHIYSYTGDLKLLITMNNKNYTLVLYRIYKGKNLF